MCRYFLCKNCGAVMDEAGIPPEYATATALQADSPAVKFYHQLACGIASIASTVLLGMKVLESMAPKGSRRFLDVGAALGHAVSLAQMKGYPSVGVEPSSMGSLGKELFGVDIVEGYLSQTRLPQKSFDLIHASEVIEHVQDPEAFVRTLSQYLSAEGVLILTTPNAEAALAGKAVEKEWYELFSPGLHMNLFSAKSLRLLLNRNGIRHVRVLPVGGTSRKKTLWVVASNHPRMGRVRIPSLREVQNEGRALSIQWLKSIAGTCESKKDFGVLYEGTLFRAVEHFVSQGAYAEALAWSQKLDQTLEKSYNGALEKMRRSEKVEFDDYLTSLPAFAGMYAYLKGMLNLNHLAKPAEAYEEFTKAADLLRLEASMVYYQSPRAGWPENARLKQGIALLNGCRYDEALHIFRQLSVSNACGAMPREANEIFFYMGLSYFYKREHRQAILYFMRHMTKKPFGYLSTRLSGGYLLRSATQWFRKGLAFR